MQASYYENSKSVNLINDKCRLKQVEEMMQFVKLKTKGSPHPTLITGDFNVDARKDLEDGTVIEGYLCLFVGTTHPLHRPEYLYTMDLAHKLFSKEKVTDLLKEACKGEHPPTYGVYDVDSKTGKKIPRGEC